MNPQLSPATVARTILSAHGATALSVAIEVVRIVAAERERLAVSHALECRPPRYFGEQEEDRIIAAVCDYYRVDERELRGLSGKRQLTAPRVAAWLLIKSRLRRSSYEIGAVFGRHYSTILSVTKRNRRLVEQTALDSISNQLDLQRSELVEAAE